MFLSAACVLSFDDIIIMDFSRLRNERKLKKDKISNLIYVSYGNLREAAL